MVGREPGAQDAHPPAHREHQDDFGVLASALARAPGLALEVRDEGGRLPTASGPVDVTEEAVRATLRRRVREMAGADDPDLEQDLANAFVDGLPGLLDEFRAAASAGDHETVRRPAHTLKSHAAFFGLAQRRRRHGRSRTRPGAGARTTRGRSS
jgi:hypothetical protein